MSDFKREMDDKLASSSQHQQDIIIIIIIKNVDPANAVSLFENRHFLTHRPQLFRTRGILCVDTIGSPHRGILCVGKIGSVAPELDG